MKSNGRHVLFSLKIYSIRFTSLQKASHRGENLQSTAFMEFSWNKPVVIPERMKRMTACFAGEKEKFTKFNSRKRRIKLSKIGNLNRSMILSNISFCYSTNCHYALIWSGSPQYLSSVHDRYPAIYVTDHIWKCTADLLSRFAQAVMLKSDEVLAVIPPPPP